MNRLSRRLAKLEATLAAQVGAPNPLAAVIAWLVARAGLPPLTWGEGRASAEYVQAWEAHASREQAELLARTESRATPAEA